MLVFLVRHAHAEPGDPDGFRSLSARGRDEARGLAERLAAHESPPCLVITSPLLRARETAQAIASATSAEVRVDDRLAPGATVEALRAALDDAVGPVAVVGHQPDCSEIAVALTAADPGFPTAGVATVRLPS